MGCSWVHGTHKNLCYAIAAHYSNILYYTALPYTALQHTIAVHYTTTLHYTALPYNVLQDIMHALVLTGSGHTQINKHCHKLQCFENKFCSEFHSALFLDPLK